MMSSVLKYLFLVIALWFVQISAGVSACQCSCLPGAEHFLVILVNARHLDYTCPKSLFKTMAKHPSDGSKNGDVGHAWIYVQGRIDGELVCVEGGHSGELGITQAKYFDGVMNFIDYGYANPTKEQLCSPRFEPNPIKYLWAVQRDGHFQQGSGYHRPTYAVKIEINPPQFQRILAFIEEYNYGEYAITGNQCSSFVTQVADLAGLQIECDVTMPIDQWVKIGGEWLKLWEDPRYSWITFSSPDIIEKSLKRAVVEGRASYALPWYLRTHPKPLRRYLYEWQESLACFPARLQRALLFR